MAYCVKCGAKVDDGIRYCPYCGGEIPLGQGQYDQQGQGQDQQYYDHGGQQSQYGQQGQYSQQGPYGQQREGYFHPEDVRANKVMAVLSYIGILVLVPLLAGNKSSEYLRHHIDQGLVIWIGSLLADILSGGGFLGFAFFSSVLSRCRCPVFPARPGCRRRRFSPPLRLLLVWAVPSPPKLRLS